MLEGVRVIVSLCSFCGSSSYVFPREVSGNFMGLCYSPYTCALITISRVTFIEEMGKFTIVKILD